MVVSCYWPYESHTTTISNTSILQQRLHPMGQSRCFHVINSFYFASILYVTKPKKSRYLTTNGSLLSRVPIYHRKAKKAATE